jgi:hypothetical protein
MRSSIALIICFLLAAKPVKCQELRAGENRILFHGIVMDAKTEIPLSNTQVFINRSFFSVSDNEGKFAFYVLKNDTVIFSRLGFKPTVLNISDTLSGKEFVAGVFMHSDTLSIGEIIIVPRLTNLKSEMMSPRTPASQEIENAKYNLEVSAYQGRVSQGIIGDPATNYGILRQKQRADSYSKGQIPSDKIVGLSPFMLIPAAYLLMNGLPAKPPPLPPRLTEQEVSQIHRKYMETLKQKK